MERIDETMEQEHFDEWSRIRQYEREHPIRDMIEWIVTMLIAIVLGAVSGVLLAVVSSCAIIGVLALVLTMLVDLGVF